MFWRFLIEYQSIFASIFTLITTLVVTHILRNKGKINFAFFGSKFKITQRDSYGDLTESSTIAENDVTSSQEIVIEFELILYNNSEAPKSLSGFEIELVSKKSCKFILPVKDLSTSRMGSHSQRIDELKILNLPPKNMLYFNLKSTMNNIDLLVAEKYNIYFVCKNTKGRAIRKYISSYRLII